VSAPFGCWIDGVPTDRLRVPDRGLEFGDGLYETMAAVAGRVRLLERHLVRLAHGCERLGIKPPEPSLLRAEIAAAAAVPGAAVVKLVLTRGAGGHGYAPAPRLAATRVLTASGLRARPAEWWHAGVVVRRCDLRLGDQPALAGLKHLNRLEQVLARAEWTDPAIAEGLLLDVHGRMVCGTMTNVFAVFDGVAVTPRLDRCGVAGVMRGALLDALPRAGVPVAEREVRPADLAGASEVFLTNALIGAWPVREFEGVTFAPGTVVRHAQALVTEW
jgi:4-amino-4-deoxychorismate lyase